MKRKLFIAVLCCAILAGCGADDMSTAVVVTQPGEDGEYVQLLERTPIAEVEGEAVSPDGRYKVLTDGAGEDCVSGVRLPDYLRVVNTETNEVLWEDSGYLWQSALWSPDGKYMALAYAGRTWNQILFFETDSWTTWQFALPKGISIPEYTFLPHENWGEWVDENTILLTVGEGGDSGEKRYYDCSVCVEGGNLRGSVEERVPETRLYHYDFNHNGKLETVILEGNTQTIEGSSFWGLNVWEENQLIWSDTAATSHAGWNNLFALKIDERDYLLRYQPSMWQGCSAYTYQIFSLDDSGEETLLRENCVEFDINFGSPIHMGFDPVEIAAFLEEVHGYLDESTLLLSTESGSFSSGGSGAEFLEDVFFWDEFCPYDPSMTLEENLRNFKNCRMEMLEING